MEVERTSFSTKTERTRDVPQMVAVPDEGSPIAEVVRSTYEHAPEGDRIDHGPDLLVREKPLEIWVDGAPVAVVMRTPGPDADLVRGFLVTERIVVRREHSRRVRPCNGVEAPEAEGNVNLATLDPDAGFDLARFRRNQFAPSSCGVSGKASVESARRTAPAVPDGSRIDRATVLGLAPPCAQLSRRSTRSCMGAPTDVRGRAAPAGLRLGLDRLETFAREARPARTLRYPVQPGPAQGPVTSSISRRASKDRLPRASMSPSISSASA